MPVHCTVGALSLDISEATIVMRSIPTMKAKDAMMGTSMKSTRRSFAAMNMRMIPRPYFRYFRELNHPLMAKYSDLSPRMANMFDV